MFLGYKKRATHSIGSKMNSNSFLGGKLIIDSAKTSGVTSSHSPEDISSLENHSDSDPKVKYSGENPKNQDVLRVKKTNKPYDGFSNFV
jgi:hypothetical protein